MEKEWTAEAHTCSNLPAISTCGMKAECDYPGLSNTNIDAPNPFPFYHQLKYMIVGDSISHGMEADWTWRYRIWEWLTGQSYPVRFVGPYGGTHGQGAPVSALPQPPLLPGETAQTTPDVTGESSPNVSQHVACVVLCGQRCIAPSPASRL